MTTYAERTEGTTIPWRLVLLEGIAAMIIGLFLLTSPGITLLFLVQVTGFFWLVGGILGIVSIFINSSLWGWKLVSGILGILAGIVVLQHSLWSTLLLPAILVVFLGAQGIVSGVIGLVMAFQGGGWGTGILGVLSILLGIVLLINPIFVGVAILPFVLGAIALVGGILAIIAAFRLRKGSAAQEAGEPTMT